jgi:hypothetical protein
MTDRGIARGRAELGLSRDGSVLAASRLYTGKSRSAVWVTIRCFLLCSVLFTILIAKLFE